MAATSTFTPAATDWTDLGVGPIKLQVYGTTRIAVADSKPALTVLGFTITQDFGPQNFNSTSHIWAMALNNTTTVIVTPQ